MRVLWITNLLFPEAAALLSNHREIKGGGGWLVGAADSLISEYSDSIELVVATVSPLAAKLTILKGKNIKYVVIPLGKGNIKYNNDYEKYWQEIHNTIHPDIVHIHGTEYSHGLAYVRACGSMNVVVSIQGLTSAYSRYYCAGYDRLQLFKNATLHDIVKGNLYRDKTLFEQRGILEVNLLQSVSHVIGRTSWDKAHTWAINPLATYHFCNETLRKEFYESETWCYSKCHVHSIFLSQAYYPIKGLQQVVSAFPLVLRHFPDALIRVAGENVLNPSYMHKTAHIKILNKFIEKNNLRNKISFTGCLSANEMVHEYLMANVFICPSSIENSPNSLGEAQILGVPHLSSYVGGTPDFMVGNEDNLYRFEETEMLAEKICRVFKNQENQVSMRDLALRRHDAKTNCKTLYNIYKQIIN